LPFFDLTYQSAKEYENQISNHWAQQSVKQKKQQEGQLDRVTVLIYNYGGVTPRQLNKKYLLKFIQQEMDPKNGMKAFNDYTAWKLEVEINPR
jgi:hypothetical protein